MQASGFGQKQMFKHNVRHPQGKSFEALPVFLVERPAP